MTHVCHHEGTEYAVCTNALQCLNNPCTYTHQGTEGVTDRDPKVPDGSPSPTPCQRLSRLQRGAYSSADSGQLGAGVGEGVIEGRARWVQAGAATRGGAETRGGAGAAKDALPAHLVHPI